MVLIHVIFPNRNQGRPKAHGLWFVCTARICQGHSCTMCRVCLLHPSKPVPNLPKSAKSHAHSTSGSHHLEVFQFEIDSLLGCWIATNCKLNTLRTHTHCRIFTTLKPTNQIYKTCSLHPFDVKNVTGDRSAFPENCGDLASWAGGCLRCWLQLADCVFLSNWAVRVLYQHAIVVLE